MSPKPAESVAQIDSGGRPIGLLADAIDGGVVERFHLPSINNGRLRLLNHRVGVRVRCIFFEMQM